MKRIGNIYANIYSWENLVLADRIARRGKANQHSIKRFDKNWEANMLRLQKMLHDKTYVTSVYTHFILHDPKERLISSLPYIDRVAHHAIMNILEGVFVATFTADTYSCIKGRGIHKAARKLKKALRKDATGTRYCLKLDVTKFYPSIDHEILKVLLRRKIKDKDLLWLLDEIIASAPGVPIGNYLSQYFANFYLSKFDHWLKEVVGVKYYFRYADDLVILSGDKEWLHELLWKIDHYLRSELKLTVKGNYQVFKVAKMGRKPGQKVTPETSGRGIDFLGYVFYQKHTLLRKTIKQSWRRAVSRCANDQSIAAYCGWGKHCDSLNLQRKFNERSKTIQRLRDKVESPDRSKNKHRISTGQNDHSNRLQDRTQQIRITGKQTDLFAIPA